MEPRTTPARSQGPVPGSEVYWRKASNTDSLATKPASGGTPAIEAAPIAATTASARADP